MIFETVNISPHAQWVGSINFELNINFAVNGQNGSSTWVNQNSYLDRGFATINVDVIGVGSFTTGFGDFEFIKSVGADQTVFGAIADFTVLDDPQHFFGTAVLVPQVGTSANGFDLADLAKADSYTFANDMLSIFSGKTAIDTLRLVNNATSNVVVDEMSNGSVLVSVTPGGYAGKGDIVGITASGRIDFGTATTMQIHI